MGRPPCLVSELAQKAEKAVRRMRLDREKRKINKLMFHPCFCSPVGDFFPIAVVLMWHAKIAHERTRWCCFFSIDPGEINSSPAGALREICLSK